MASRFDRNDRVLDLIRVALDRTLVLLDAALGWRERCASTHRDTSRRGVLFDLVICLSKAIASSVELLSDHVRVCV